MKTIKKNEFLTKLSSLMKEYDIEIWNDIEIYDGGDDGAQAYSTTHIASGCDVLVQSHKTINHSMVKAYIENEL